MNTEIFDDAKLKTALDPVWEVSSLIRSVTHTLDQRFDRLSVQGEISGFVRAASGHCYFSLKDDYGQLRCVMFRRTAAALRFAVQDGDLVQVQASLTVYAARGDLQLLVTAVRRAGQGMLLEQFLRLKEKLQGEGLFAAGRKRPLPAMPRGIGLVTSLGAAALRDVLSTLARRAPHVPVWIAPAAVQGEQAPQALVGALRKLQDRVQADRQQAAMHPVDVILLVRGGGSIEDLWAFNDEQLARTIAQMPVPVISGIGHETDFTIADFVADLRAPTPTAAAELVCPSRQQSLSLLQRCEADLKTALQRRLNEEAQKLDKLLMQLGRPRAFVVRQRTVLLRLAQNLQHLGHMQLQAQKYRLAHLHQRLQAVSPAWLASRQQKLLDVRKNLTQATARYLLGQQQRLQPCALSLSLLDPAHTLARGYAWLESAQGEPVSRVKQVRRDDELRVILHDGRLDVHVAKVQDNGPPANAENRPRS